MNKISEKSRTTATLLSLFLGAWGAHRFYAGKKGSAIAMLVISCTIVGLLITGVWNTIDFIMVIAGSFKDENGDTIKNW